MRGLLVMMALSAAATPDQASVDKEVAEWRRQRLERLTADGGWLTLAGLVWLHEGAQTAGSDGKNAVQLPAGMPPMLGMFTLGKDGSVVFSPHPAALVTRENGVALKGAFTLTPDSAGEPTTLKVDTFSFFVIKRGDRTGLRIKNSNAETRKTFHGIDSFPPSPAWVITAKWQPFPKPEKIKVPNVLNQVEDMDSPGVAVFSVGGQELKLQPVLEEGSNELFFIFSDETAKKETYGAGRFLYSAQPKNGTVILDFNHAYNPPCAFTPYATCPIPPSQNRLPIRIEAGEKRYGNH